MNKPGSPRLAILGGGPIGLEAALYAKQAGCTVTLFEQGSIAESVNRWGFARMFTPFRMNSTTLGKQVLRFDRAAPDLPADTEYLTGREYRDAYLLPLAASGILKESIRTQAIVVSIDALRKEDNSLEVYIDGGRTATGLHPADWARECERLGAGEILINSIDRDGCGYGYDLDLVHEVAIVLPLSWWYGVRQVLASPRLIDRDSVDCCIRIFW